MKNINLYILGLMSILLSISCNDAIEITQPGRFSADNAFQSVDDLQLGLLGAYNQLDLTDQISFNSTFTDEMAIGFDNGGQGLGDGRYGYILNATSIIPGRTWTDHYDAINASTRLIVAGPTLEVDPARQGEFNNILGQAHAIRAWSHFVLFSYFTTDYTNDGALSAIAIDFIPELTIEPGRSTVGEMVSLINSDLDRAASLLDGDTSNNTFMNVDFVTALRARLAAYRQDYGAAAGFASELAGRYPLADQTQYFDMFDDLDNTEVIFKLERAIGDPYDGQATEGGGWAGALYAFVDATIDGSPYFECSRSLFNCMEDGDIRLERIIDPTSVVDPGYETSPDARASDILVIRKYPGSDGQPLMNDLKVFRSSEMVLIQAEAAAATGNLGGAASFVKQIRDARYGSNQPTPSYGSATAAFADILKERRVELAFEGHRYLDIKRLGARAGVTIDRDAIDCAVNDSCNSPSSDDFRFTLPIPQVELNANSVIREQQNPGY